MVMSQDRCKLARLNGMAVAYEWDVEADGNAHFALWEWN
jgi:hypothetical protein